MNLFKKQKTLENVTNSWLLYKKPAIKPTTYYRYQYIINKYILAYFPKKDIRYFETYDFSTYINSLLKNNSSKTVKDILIVFIAILKFCERKYSTNYMLDLISYPQCECKEIQILKDNEREKLESYCFKKQDLRALGIIICLHTGMRIGEICALTWNNIDLENGFFIINKSLQRIYKGKNNTIIHINTPKTHNSIRKIPISKKILDILKVLNKSYKFTGNEYFLTGTNLKYIEPRNYQNLFKKYLSICQIQEYNFHVLRHTFATNCIKVGMDIKSLSEILGHANTSITLNRYIHSSYSIQKKFLEKL